MSAKDRKLRDPFTEAFFTEEFGAPIGVGAPSTLNKANAFASLTRERKCQNPFAGSVEQPDKICRIFAADGFVPTPQTPAIVTLLFGEGSAMNRLGLRSFFRPGQVLVTVPGIEPTKENGGRTGPVGIKRTDFVELLNARFGGDQENRFEIQTLAAVGTGTLGLMSMVHQVKTLFEKHEKEKKAKVPETAPSPDEYGPNELLGAADRVVFYDALGGAVDPNELRATLKFWSKNSRLRCHAYALTKGGSVRLPVITAELKAHVHIIDLRARKEWQTLILRRLMENAIADGWLSAAQLKGVAPTLAALAIPPRSRVASSEFHAGNGAIAVVSLVDDLKAVPQHEREAALDLVVANRLTGRPPPDKVADPKHPFECLDDQALAEHGWEALVPERPVRYISGRPNAFYAEEFGPLLTTGRRDNLLAPGFGLGPPGATDSTPLRPFTQKVDPLDAVERAPTVPADKIEEMRKTRYSAYVASGSAGPLKLTLHFAVGSELGRHGLRTFFVGQPNRAIIVISGVESKWPEAGGKAWAKSIDRKAINAVLAAEVGHEGFTDRWTVEVLAGYSTGYRGVVASLCHALPPAGKPQTLDLDLTGLRRVIFYDALYLSDDRPVGFRTEDALRAAARVNPEVEIITYCMTQGGHNSGAIAHVPPLRPLPPKQGLFLDGRPLASQLRMIYYARILLNAVADGYFARTRIPAEFLAVMDLVAKVPRGTLCSSQAVFDGLNGELQSVVTLAPAFIKEHQGALEAASKVQHLADVLFRWYRLVGWGYGVGELDHDMFIPEFGWEFLPA